MKRYSDAAFRLFQHLITHHWDGDAITGPDPIGKINWRLTRFLKSYTRWLPWNDKFEYIQGQSYWIRSNLSLYELTNDDQYLQIVTSCADFILDKQLPSGVWEHPPIHLRKGFISTVETVWACLGLMFAYQKLGNQAYLDATLRGYHGILSEIGLREYKDSLGVNYHAHTRLLVPNATTMLLWLIAELYKNTGDESYLKHTDELIRFIEYSQMESGELPYWFEYRQHFQCFQYNSFQFLDLKYFFDITGNELVLGILKRLAQYLSIGVTERGSCRYDCFKELPETVYWTGALASALREAHELGLGDYLLLSERAYSYLLSLQKQDGAFDFSSRNYGFLRDKRSYPRYLAMILNHLLHRAQIEHVEIIGSS